MRLINGSDLGIERRISPSEWDEDVRGEDDEGRDESEPKSEKQLKLDAWLEQIHEQQKRFG